MKRSVAQLPLHGGKAPAWLFGRMKQLAGAVVMAVVEEYGPEEMLGRLADPWWFQAFGCALGFDWHSSGLTTVTCGALKAAAKALGDDLGILVAGGKGATSRKTPAEIAAASDRRAITGGDRLIYASRTSAKVDSSAVQDGFQIYHHSFFFTPGGAWCVVQQGMNESAGTARRYHWLGQSVDDFVCEPHAAISDLGAMDSLGSTGVWPVPGGVTGQTPVLASLNMVAWEADANRQASAELARGNPDKLLRELARLTDGPTLFLPDHHPVLPQDVNLPRLEKIIRAAHEAAPEDFEALLGVVGVGPATVRALSLLAELIYQAPASHRDPAQGSTGVWPVRGGVTGETPVLPHSPRYADYSYAHGGKDGFPFPVDCGTYDRSIEVLTSAVRRARLGDRDKTDALRRIARLAGRP